MRELGEGGESATEMYPVPASDVYPDLVIAAGGAGAVAKLAQRKLDEDRAAEALHLSEMALAAAPKNEAALRAKLAACEKLLEESNDENHYEVFLAARSDQRSPRRAWGIGTEPTRTPLDLD